MMAGSPGSENPMTSKSKTTKTRWTCKSCGKDGHQAKDCPGAAKTPKTPERKKVGMHTLEAMKGRCVINAHDCWVWTGASAYSKGDGLGLTSRVWLPLKEHPAGGTLTTAHRAAWLLSGRPLPNGHVVWHSKCTDPLCINPAHCSSGTRQEMHKAIAASDRLKGKTNRKIANAKNRLAMVTPVETVRKAEGMFRDGLLQKDVRAALGLSGNTARLIRLGQHTHSADRPRVVPGASAFTWAAQVVAK